MSHVKSLAENILPRLEVAAQNVRSRQELATVRADVLGKKGALGEALRGLKDVPAADRPAVGQDIHVLKQQIDAILSAAAERVAALEREKLLEASRYDVTLPGRRQPQGAEHPLRIVAGEIIRCLMPLGFSVVEGPEVEHEWYNFDALNIAADHPARDLHDSFFIRPDIVLRTHTSNVQIRTMATQPPPVRILAPGMVFRRDEVDATHSPAFHQIEGLWIDEHATFADLKGVLRTVTSHLFGAKSKTRFRPSYFPFTEPSCEVDVSCVECGGRTRTDCKICKGSGWLEVLGAGMVHPAVLEAVHYDAEKVQGFAFGIGLDRVAMLRWGIDDIRLLYDNDVRFLQQIAGVHP